MHRAQRKGAVERQAGRSREGQRGPQVKTTSAERGSPSDPLHHSLGQQARASAGRLLHSFLHPPPPTKAPGPAAILCLAFPDNPQLESLMVKPYCIEAGQPCQGAGLRLWPERRWWSGGGTEQRKHFQTSFGRWLPYAFQSKTYAGTKK